MRTISLLIVVAGATGCELKEPSDVDAVKTEAADLIEAVGDVRFSNLTWRQPILCGEVTGRDGDGYLRQSEKFYGSAGYVSIRQGSVMMDRLKKNFAHDSRGRTATRQFDDEYNECQSKGITVASTD